MAYTALYRKFRPQEFEAVKGQDHIIQTLQNQINSNRVGHAYLFCGTRGTGKTTVAKIFAKAVNCNHPILGSPCMECESCQSIAAGNSMNVIEIDAASNNGVDNIREIREEVSYSPTEGKYKVYIIDEVHMLSIGAFNALLKTLEEPPAYVIFILATTEAHKIPITILSRCQRYDFKRISIDIISSRLMQLMQQEQIETEEKAVRYIAKTADGSMRDALSLLEQCSAFYFGQKLTYDNVLEVLGAVDTTVFSRFLRKIVEQDVLGLISLLDEIIMNGREPAQFVIDFTWYLRNLLLVQSSENMEDVLELSTENILSMKEESKMVSSDTLIRDIRIFSELSNQLRYAVQKRVLIEIALIKLCRPQMEQNMEALLERVRLLEEKIEAGVVVEKASASNSNRTESREQQQALILSKAIPADIETVVKNWSSIIQILSGTVKTYLKSARLSLLEDNRLLVVFDDEMAEAYVNTDIHKKELVEAIQSRIGKEIDLVITRNKTDQAFEESYIDIEKIIHMDITIEE